MLDAQLVEQLIYCFLANRLLAVGKWQNSTTVVLATYNRLNVVRLHVLPPKDREKSVKPLVGGL